MIQLLERDANGYYSNTEDVEIYCVKDSEYYLGTILYNTAS
jgi:hypothetical protein